jgi:phage internal scaffolding protein
MSFSDRRTRRVQVDASLETPVVEQNHKESCDIHHIMRKYERNGVLTHVRDYAGTYMELPSEVDFHLAMNQIAAAQQSFESLPADLRKKFGNDPATFVDFMQDGDNLDAIEKLGLDASHLDSFKARELDRINAAKASTVAEPVSVTE